MSLGNFEDAGVSGLWEEGKEELRKMKPGPESPRKDVYFESDAEQWKVPNRREHDHCFQGPRWG